MTFRGRTHSAETREKLRTARRSQSRVVGGGPAATDPFLRFVRKVQSNGSCLEWTGALDSKGYGAFSVGSMRDGTRRVVRAHRFAFEQVHGPVPDGLELDHLCSNRKCCSPDHLEAVTHAENLRRIG